MWLLVFILASAAALSALWLLVAVGVHLAQRARGRASGWIAGSIRRPAIMTIACSACAAGIHLGMTRADGFPRQMPAALLTLDVASPWYGRIALRTLADRAAQHTLPMDTASGITDALLDADWWLDETHRRLFDNSRQSERWFTIQMEQARLSDEQLARWLNLVPPPMFLANADTRQSPSSISITAVFGREWQRIDNVPYRVNRLEITEIRVNGESQEFTLEEAADSQSDIGWYATRVEFHVLGLHAPPDSSPRCEIEVIYRVDLEPSSYRNIGPLRWTTTLVVN